MNKAVFKFNSGYGALLCSKCHVIIKTGQKMTEKEWKALRGEIDLPPQYCEKCKSKL